MLHGETVRTNFNLIRKRSFYFVTTKCLTHFYQVLIAKYKLCKYKTLGTHLLLLPSYQIIRHKMILQNNLSRRENISNLTSAGRLTRWKPRAMFQMTSPPSYPRSNINIVQLLHLSLQYTMDHNRSLFRHSSNAGAGARVLHYHPIPPQF